MPTAKDSNNDDVKRTNAPTQEQFEAFTARLLTVRKQELDARVARQHGRQKRA
jgi:hypothetical protein